MRRQRGFTLIEMVVVLAVLGLALALLASRGPPRSAALDIRSAADALTQGLRLARSRAIAANQPVSLMVDPARRAWAVDGMTAHSLPQGVVVSLRGDRSGAIRFAPDGRASGDLIELADGQRRLLLGIDWLSGRVMQTDAR